jgi:hypothetical protein
MLSERLQQHLGARIMQQQDEVIERESKFHCPPVDPMLIKHLKYMFQDPVDKAKPTNPQLAQLLTIQYGCDKVINYLTKQWEQQSAAARKDREI